MMKNTRMSRRKHTPPRLKNEQVDVSGLRGTEYRSGSVLRNPGDPPSAPKKHRPFAVYPLTPPPLADSESRHLGEGPVRGRQADKGR